MHPTASHLNTLRPAGRGGRRPWGKASGARTRSTAWVLWLTCALLLAPLFSRLHQTLHPGHGHAALVTQISTLPDMAGVPSAHATAERSVWERLFSPHVDGSTVCQLLDHGSTPQADGPQAPAWVFDVPALWLAPPPSRLGASGPVAFFQARGPPVFL